MCERLRAVLPQETKTKGSVVAKGINNSAIDRFTAVHFATGLALGTVLPLHIIFFVALAFELGEDTLKDRFPWVFPHPSHDTKRNALVDAGAMVLGAIATRGSPGGRILGS